jgi:hypothetical protein
MIQATVDEALGPILDLEFRSGEARERVAELLSFAYPRIEEYEATHRATLIMALDQWIRRQAGTLGEEPEVKRGHRRDLLREAVKPLKSTLGRQAFDRLTQSLSLIFGAEAFVVLKDIWGLDGDEARRTALWAAKALVDAAVAEANGGGETRRARTAGNAASRPRKTRK